MGVTFQYEKLMKLNVIKRITDVSFHVCNINQIKQY